MQLIIPMRFFLLLIPLLQLGFTFYISFQILLFGVLFWQLLKPLSAKESVSILTFVLALFFLKYFVDSSIATGADVLVTGREAICFYVFMLAVLFKGEEGALLQKVEYLDEVRKYLRLFFCVSFLLVFIQSLLILGGWYVGFPSDWYIANQGTYEGISEALFYGTRIRPTGFYGEPSYMGFVLIALGAAYYKITKAMGRGSIDSFIYILIISSVLLLKSGAAIAALLVLLFVFEFKAVVRYWYVLTFLVVAFFLVGGDVVDRLMSNEEDVSFNVRFEIPLIIIREFIFSGDWVGVDIESLNRYVYLLDISSIDNSFLYLFLHYGFFSIVIFLFFAGAVIKRLGYFAFILFCLFMNFNGGILSYDKVVVICYLFLILKMCSEKGLNLKVAGELKGQSE